MRTGCKPIHVYTCIHVSSCVWMHVAAVSTRLVRSKPVTGDLDPIRIRHCYGPDSQAIQRPTYEMIRRSVTVRAVKIRRQIGSKTASFHVSVCSHVFSLLLLPVGVHVSIRIISYNHMI